MKKNLIYFGLILITIFMVFAIIYVSSLLKESPSPRAAMTVKKIKAQSQTYTRYLDINTGQGSEQGLESTANLPTPTPTEIIVASPTTKISLTPNPSLPISPTEIILAYNDNIDEKNASPSPTGITSLPESGWIQSSLAIFAAATLIIFISFLY
ncbi:MAG: hypothetical protein QHH09_02995 [Microgenomates group bacterium]|nr:hypothetical protein [Microgenomates group bacterium]